jgi:excisionase family DNA binding protein
VTGQERPSRIVHGSGEVVLNAKGAAMVLAALDLALAGAPPGYRFAAGHGDSDFAWLRRQCELVASGTGTGAAAGTEPRRFTLVMPSSGPVPELLTTRQAAEVIHISPRAVVKRIEAGQLPAVKVGREWAITEYDARSAARTGGGDGRQADPDDGGPGRPARRRRGQVGADPAVAGAVLGGPDHGGRPGGGPGGDDAAGADPGGP